MDVALKRDAASYAKLCWWLLHDLAKIGDPVKKSTIRRDFCEHLKDFTEEEAFGGLDLFVKAKFVNYSKDDNTYEIRKEGYDFLKDVFDKCVINETTVKFITDRSEGHARNFCNYVAHSDDKFKAFYTRAATHIDEFMPTIRILLQARSMSDPMLKFALALIDFLRDKL